MKTRLPRSMMTALSMMSLSRMSLPMTACALLALAWTTPATAQFSLESRRPAPADTAAAPTPATAPVAAPAPPDATPAAMDATAGLPGLVERLGKRHPLRVTLYSRETWQGKPARVTADSLWLEGAPGIALGDVARVEQHRSGAEEGAHVAGAVGMLLGGGLGAALGFSVPDHDDGGGSHRVSYVLTGTMVGIMAIGLPITLIGGGVGAFTEAWYTVYPPGLADRLPPEDDDRGAVMAEAQKKTRTPQRLLLEAGWSTGSEDPLASSGGAVGLALLSRASSRLEYGPAIRYNALQTTIDVPARTTSNEMTHVPAVATMSFDLRLQATAARSGPWAAGGVGLSLANELRPGAHLGAGWRVRDAKGHDYGVFVRRQFRVGVQEDAIADFWTFGAGFTFGI